MDFLSITDPDQGVRLFNQWIPRARLVLHLRLARLATEIDDILNSGRNTAELIGDYLDKSGVDRVSLTGSQQLQVYVALLDLNGLKNTLAFQQWIGEPDTKPPPYDYPGRNWAWWVHKLASRYGWTQEQIFQLWPEEAAAYLQEILIAEYDEADEARSLSEIAYHYDSHTKKATFRPIPRPSWIKEKPDEKPKIRRIRRDMLPMGNIIDLTNKTEDDFTILH